MKTKRVVDVFEGNFADSTGVAAPGGSGDAGTEGTSAPPAPAADRRGFNGGGSAIKMAARVSGSAIEDGREG